MTIPSHPARQSTTPPRRHSNSPGMARAMAPATPPAQTAAGRARQETASTPSSTQTSRSSAGTVSSLLGVPVLGQPFIRGPQNEARIFENIPLVEMNAEGTPVADENRAVDGTHLHDGTMDVEAGRIQRFMTRANQARIGFSNGMVMTAVKAIAYTGFGIFGLIKVAEFLGYDGSIKGHGREPGHGQGHGKPPI